MACLKVIVLIAVLQNVVTVNCWYWQKYDTGGKICHPAPIGVPAYSEKQCQDACSKRSDVKFCQFNTVSKNWCMMGKDCPNQWLHATHRYVVWQKKDGQPGKQECIKLVHGEPCSCAKGNCDQGKVNIKKQLGGKCGVAVKHHNEACNKASCGPSFSKKMMDSSWGLSWHYNWGTIPSPWWYTKGIKFIPQFWGPREYQNFPQLKLDGDFLPQKDYYVLPIILGFNEPDLTGHGASSMSVDTAVKFWKINVINGIKKGYRQFVSPAMALALPRKYNLRVRGNDWLPRFLDRLAGEPRYHKDLVINGKTFNVEIDWKTTVDYVAVHKYEANCQISVRGAEEWLVDVPIGAAKRLIQDYNKKGFNMKGVWLTEFAGTKDKCRYTWQQKEMLEKWVKLLLEDDDLTAMSWFSYDGAHSRYFSVPANLWDYKTEKPNDLGKKYFELCSKHRY